MTLITEQLNEYHNRVERPAEEAEERLLDQIREDEPAPVFIRDEVQEWEVGKLSEGAVGALQRRYELDLTDPIKVEWRDPDKTRRFDELHEMSPFVDAMKRHIVAFHEAAALRTSLSRIFGDIGDERAAQLRRWGVQRHPHANPNRVTPTHVQMADEYRSACDFAAETGNLSWEHILLEETWEALAETTDLAKRRVELIQAIAVMVAEIEQIDEELAAEKTEEN